MKYMLLAIQESLKAPWYGYIPIGAVLTCNGTLIFKGHNHETFDHVEFLIIKSLFKSNNNKNNNYVLYITQEPCIMCWFLIHNSPIKSVYFGTFNEFYGGYSNNITWKNKVKKNIFGGIEEETSLRILQSFFKNKR